MRRVPLSELKDNLSWFLREAEGEEIVIIRDAKPAGLLIGFASEEDWLDYQLEHDPRFLSRIEQARKSLRTGHGVRIEDLQADLRLQKKTIVNFEKGTKEISRAEGYQSLTLKASLSWNPQDAGLTRSALDEDPPGARRPMSREDIEQSKVIAFPRRAA